MKYKTTYRFNLKWYLAGFFTLILIGYAGLSIKSFYLDESLNFTERLFLAVDIVTLTGFSDSYFLSKFNQGGLYVIIGLMLSSAVWFVFFISGLIIRYVSLRGDFLPKSIQNPWVLLKNISLYFLLLIFGLFLLLWYSSSEINFERQEDRIFFSLFQAVSAFCNAGFDLLTINVGNYKKELLMVYYFCVGSGTLFGGLGYLVTMDLFHPTSLRQRLANPKLDWQKISYNAIKNRGVLLMIGAGFFMLTSYTFLNKDESQLEKIVYTFFTLIESGTGGFTIHQTLPLSNTLLVIIIITMFVGGNTGSTAGGFGAGKTGYLFLTLKHGGSGSNAAGQIAIRLLLISAVIILLLTM